jgi:hypothetical protein
VIIGLLLLAVFALGEEPPEGFTALFNGKDLDGFYGHGTEDPRKLWALSPEALEAHKEKTREDLAKHWRVEDGVLINDGHGLYATTDRDYADFELLLEYKTVAGADSGIYLRGCPQVQIWDTTEAGGKWGIGADKGSGGLWNNSPGAPGKDPSKKMDKPFGEWNKLRIGMIGSHVSVWMNGERIVDFAVMENYFDRSIPVFRKGPIQLQTHGGEIQWRNLFIREIGIEEATEVLEEHDSEGFVALFNGKDLSGWQKTDGYVVQDSNLVCTPQGGVIFTEKPYEDYVLYFKFKLTEGANNGLAIHYPGEGNPAYAGIELQILDNASPRYAKLQPWQYHGSAYGIKAAHRGFQRPAGQWNNQRVTCKGSRITVELNGTRITDVDLFKTEPADGRDHPGMKRTSGHIGFFGHGSRVEFRRIKIRSL